ncbi:hypothetical protein SKAU_G00038390 [Synaphobranchus kaupii]|uniref:Interleukin n=1 Tax=Synaphobranchus kaupii TaxID=118154 RepID=A0A9Q1GGS6_SYNKA|nr:hypothetical protein SKAU_G00038390 [Synaphobranchus kaupii]
MMTRSDATYYNPGNETISEACFNKTLLCYVAEAQVILYETTGERSINLLEPTRDHIPSQNSGNASCLPCEAFQEADAVTFLKSFHTFLERKESDDSFNKKKKKKSYA